MKRGRFPMVEAVYVRLSIEEKQAMQEAARKSNQTVSEYIRTVTTRAALAVAA